MKEQKLLTETELELMKLLWAIGEGSVRDVLNKLPKTRKMAYTSASTIIRILEKKEFLASRKEGLAHIYTPTITREEYENTSLNSLANKLFDDAPLAMVAKMIDTKSLTAKDLEMLRNMIDEKLKQ